MKQQLTFILLSTLVLLITLIMNVLASTKSLTPGIFTTPISNIDKLYSLEISPPFWVYGGLIVIGILFALWHIYSIVNICTATQHTRSPPQAIHPVLYPLFTTICLLNIAYLFLQDQGYFWWTSAIFLLKSVLLTVCLYLGLSRYKSFCEAVQGVVSPIRYNIVIICSAFNGLGSYLIWTYFMTYLHCLVALVDKNYDTESMGIWITFVEVGSFLLLDIILLRRYTKHLLGPYLMLMWLATGIFGNNHHETIRSSTLKIILLVLMTVLIFCKLLDILIDIIRTRSRSHINNYTNLEYIPFNNR